MCSLFIDNIFRFTQAGSEVSALLGRMPSAVGYQPTLATDMGALQERITSTNKGSVTVGPGRLRPADDLTDPAPANTFAHLDGTIVLCRARSPSSAFIRLWIRWIPLQPYHGSQAFVGEEHLQRGQERTDSLQSIRICRTSSPFWDGRTLRRRSALPLTGPGRSSVS